MTLLEAQNEIRIIFANSAIKKSQAGYCVKYVPYWSSNIPTGLFEDV